jgi:phosphoribosylanthranilate isomerase
VARTRVKICGIRSAGDACAAVDAGADALGLVFYAASARAVDVAAAARICNAVAPLVSIVALFVEPTVQEVERVLAACPVDLLQFHGDEDAPFCEQFQRPYLKALRMRPGLDVGGAMARHPRARAFLFDAWHPEQPGGTGQTFDWQRLPTLDRPWLLAGGLTPDNVGSAITRLRPPAVDFSGGVESAPGQKDRERLRRFMAAVRAADHNECEDAA